MRDTEWGAGLVGLSYKEEPRVAGVERDGRKWPMGPEKLWTASRGRLAGN